MENYNIKILGIVFLLTIALVFSAAGCSNFFKRPKEQSSQAGEQKKAPPKPLTTMENDTQKMIEDIQKTREQRWQKIRQEQDKMQQVGGTQEKLNKNQEETKGSKSNDSTAKADTKAAETKDQKSKETNLPEIQWSNIEKTIKKLQNTWNHYAGQAAKDGASEKLLIDFEKQLDALTVNVMEHNEDQVITAANELYGYYPKFLNLYKHKAPPDVKEGIYYTRQIVIDGEKDKWDDSREKLESIEKAWDNAKARMDKPNRDHNHKVEIAIEGFARSVQQKNIELVKIKGDILINNLKNVK